MITRPPQKRGTRLVPILFGLALLSGPVVSWAAEDDELHINGISLSVDSSPTDVTPEQARYDNAVEQMRDISDRSALATANLDEGAPLGDELLVTLAGPSDLSSTVERLQGAGFKTLTIFTWLQPPTNGQPITGTFGLPSVDISIQNSKQIMEHIRSVNEALLRSTLKVIYQNLQDPELSADDEAGLKVQQSQYSELLEDLATGGEVWIYGFACRCSTGDIKALALTVPVTGIEAAASYPEPIWPSDPQLELLLRDGRPT